MQLSLSHSVCMIYRKIKDHVHINVEVHANISPVRTRIGSVYSSQERAAHVVILPIGFCQQMSVIILNSSSLLS